MKRALIVFAAAALFAAGFLLAFILYFLPLGGETSGLFSWGVATHYSPIVAAFIGLASATIVMLWLLRFAIDSGSRENRSKKREKIKKRGGIAALISISLIWVGFGLGLLGPAVLGTKPAYQAQQDTIGDSLVHPAKIDKFKMPDQLHDFWGGERPGPYLAVSGNGTIFVAVNSSAHPSVYHPDKSERVKTLGFTSEVGSVMLATLDISSTLELTDAVNLSFVDDRIQHVRDLEVHENGLIFSNIQRVDECLVLQVWSYAPKGDRFANWELRLLWQTSPCISHEDSPEGWVNAQQSGGRLASYSSSILVTVGDFRMGESTNNDFLGRPQALGQAPSDTLNNSGDYGQIWKVESDGTATPFSSGHRNPQGLFFDSISDTVMSTEHGPAGGDEINFIVQGSDYGWPDETLGGPYSSDPYEELDVYRYFRGHVLSKPPAFSWLPSIGPSDLFVYRGDQFAGWKGDIILATLRDESIRRLRVSEGNIIFDERIRIGERIRDIQEHPSGSIVMTFDSGYIGILSKR